MAPIAETTATENAAPEIRCIAFEGFRRIAAGKLAHVARKTKAVLDSGERAPVLIFDESSSTLVEVDFRGTLEQVLRRLETPAVATLPQAEAPTQAAAARGPGRPKLGVVAREVTLLPRHWEWLASQPGGASVALRKLVEEARRDRRMEDLRRQKQEAAYQFLHALAGNLPGFEEVTRALFAPQPERFDELTQPWPRDVRDHARKLAKAAFVAGPAGE
jgi:hypothetical protein